MSWEFPSFEKLREIFEGIRKGAWFLVPIVGFFVWLQWILLDWLPARAIAVMDDIQARLPEIEIDVSAVNIAWGRVNQWVPLNEAVLWGSMFLTLALLLVVARFVKKMIFFG